MKYGLPETSFQSICDVLASYPQVDRAILYGSRAKGNYRNGSDIDLTLQGGEELTLRTLFRIMDDLDDLLLPYTMDLSLFRHISDADLIDHIQRVGVVFYRKDHPIIETTQAHTEPDPVAL